MQITKIVITGGSHNEKKMAINEAKRQFEEFGYTVFLLPNIELITDCKKWLSLQLQNERNAQSDALSLTVDEIIVLCDGGALDIKSHVTSDEFENALLYLNKNEIELRDNYDAVFYLSAECDANIEGVSAWIGHPHLRVIKNLSCIKEKISLLMEEMTLFLGVPEPYEIERKLLIEYPDIEFLGSNPYCNGVDIVQTYLEFPNGKKTRIRQRGKNGNYIYFQTTKRQISDIKRVEEEKRLTKNEYLTLLNDENATKYQLFKTRYCLLFDNQYFEIDIYPFWNDKAIMEIELRKENQAVHFPPEIKIIKDVTSDDRYKNSALAKMLK